MKIHPDHVADNNVPVLPEKDGDDSFPVLLEESTGEIKVKKHASINLLSSSAGLKYGGRFIYAAV